MSGDVPLLGDVLWQHRDGTVATAGRFPGLGTDRERLLLWRLRQRSSRNGVRMIRRSGDDFRMHCLSRHLGCQRRGNMNPALVLIGIYIIVTAALQFVGFLISQVVSAISPPLSLMTFLVLFIGMFYLAWPIACRISDWLIPETEADRRRVREVAEGQRLSRTAKTNQHSRT